MRISAQATATAVRRGSGRGDPPAARTPLAATRRPALPAAIRRLRARSGPAELVRSARRGPRRDRRPGALPPARCGAAAAGWGPPGRGRAGGRRDRLPDLPAGCAAPGVHPDREVGLMPIRSQHGRAAAYRALWQWPLRSVRRLVITVLALLVLAGGVSYTIASLGIGSRAGGTGRCRRWPVGCGSRGAVGHRAAAGAGAANRRRCRCRRRPRPRWTWPGAGPGPGSGRRPGSATSSGWPGCATPRPRSTSGCWPRWTRRTSRRPGWCGNPKAVRVSPRSVQVQVQTDGPTLLVLVVDTDAGWRVAGYDRT